VEIAGTGRDPGGQWMVQMARNLVDMEDGFLRKKSLEDRRPGADRIMGQDAVGHRLGIEVAVVRPKAPQGSAHAIRPSASRAPNSLTPTLTRAAIRGPACWTAPSLPIDRSYRRLSETCALG
jgi:hypothetical protein